MAKFEIVSKYVDAGLTLPVRATAYSAGYDLSAAEDIIIPPYEDIMECMIEGWVNCLPKAGFVFDLTTMADYTGKISARPTLIPTGIKCKLAENEYLKLVSRSSMPLKHWIICANSEGIIDADYYNNPNNEGHIFFQVINFTPVPIKIHKGDKICQAIIQKYEITEDDEASGKRAGGFGSTGV